MITQIFDKKNKDILKKIVFTLVILLIIRIGTFIRVPGTSDITSSLGMLEIFNMMNGGALQNFSIFALSVSPYISASIVTQILQLDIFPYFKELKHQGAEGQNKLNKINRYLGIGLAFIQGYLLSASFILNATVSDNLKAALYLTAGTAIVLWLGDRISSKGIGNGISLIIMTGIVSTLPSMFTSGFTHITSNANNVVMGYSSFAVFVFLYLAIIVAVIYMQEAIRKIPIQYSNKSAYSHTKQQSFLPFKINSAGVMPVVFASMILSFFTFLSGIINNAGFTKFVANYLTYDTGVGLIIYLALIFLFVYLYTSVIIKPADISENLNKNGGFVPGIRPGNDTKIYITDVIKKITFVGALFLMAIAALPILFANITNLPANVSLGGTGLLIVVGVAIETYKQIESTLISRNYRG